MDFKYKTSFSAVITTLVSEEKDKFLALASAEKLKSIIPEYVKGDKNIDLLPFAASLCNVNKANKNRDLIGSNTALGNYKNFFLRPINTRHRRDTTAGVIVNVALCKFGSEDLITEEEAKESKVFNVAIAGVIYKVVNSELADLLEECSDPDSENYNKLSLSWEIGFNEYDILVGSPYLSEGKVISSDSPEFEKYDKILLANDQQNTNQVYRLIKGDIYPLGAGIVDNPAGYVKGIYTPEEEPENEEREEEEEHEDEMEEMEGYCPACNENKLKFSKSKDRVSCSKCDSSYSGTYWVNLQDAYKNSMASNKPVEITVNLNSSVEKTESISKILAEESQAQAKLLLDHNLNADLNKKSVTINKTNMKIQKIEDITDENLVEAKASEIIQLISQEIRESCKNLSVEVEDKEKKLSAAEAAIENLNTSVQALQKKIQELTSEALARAANDKFNARLAEINEKYELTDAVRAIVGKKASTLNDEEYNTFLSEFEVMNKASVKTKAPNTAVASVTDAGDAAKAATDSAAQNADKKDIPNAAAPATKFEDKFANAFSEKNITLK